MATKMVKKKTATKVYAVITKTYSLVNLISPDVDILSVHKTRKGAKASIDQNKGNDPRHTHTRYEVIKCSLKS
jgi:hypothetical protein